MTTYCCRRSRMFRWTARRWLLYSCFRVFTSSGPPSGRGWCAGRCNECQLCNAGACQVYFQTSILPWSSFSSMESRLCRPSKSDLWWPMHVLLPSSYPSSHHTIISFIITPQGCTMYAAKSGSVGPAMRGPWRTRDVHLLGPG